MRFSHRWRWLAVLTAAVLLIAIPASAGAQYTDYRQSAGDQYGQPSGQPAVAAKARVCTSRRRFRLTLRARGGALAVRAQVRLNGRLVRVRRQRGRRTVVVDLLGRKAGTVTIRVRGRTKKGRRFTRTYRYRTCIKRAQTRNVFVKGKPTSATTTPASGLPGGSALVVLGIALLGGGALTAAGMRVRKRR
jgi:hypothetical protein